MAACQLSVAAAVEQRRQHELEVGLLRLGEPERVDRGVRVVPAVELEHLEAERPLEVHAERAHHPARQARLELEVARVERVDAGRRHLEAAVRASASAARTTRPGRAPRRSARRAPTARASASASAREASTWQRQTTGALAAPAGQARARRGVVQHDQRRSRRRRGCGRALAGLEVGLPGRRPRSRARRRAARARAPPPSRAARVGRTALATPPPPRRRRRAAAARRAARAPAPRRRPRSRAGRARRAAARPRPGAPRPPGRPQRARSRPAPAGRPPSAGGRRRPCAGSVAAAQRRPRERRGARRPPSSAERRLDPAAHLAERLAAQHHLVAVLEERARRAVRRARSAPRRSSSARSGCRAPRARARRSCRWRAGRRCAGSRRSPSGGRSAARSTSTGGACSSARSTAPFSSTSSGMSYAQGSSAQVRQRLRAPAARRGTRRSASSVERHDPVGSPTWRTTCRGTARAAGTPRPGCRGPTSRSRAPCRTRGRAPARSAPARPSCSACRSRSRPPARCRARALGPNSGPGRWPLGRRTGVPLGTTVPARPW